MNDNAGTTKALIINVAVTIRETRAMQGMTQAELAAASGISADELSSIEQGHESLKIASVCRVAEALGLQPVFLLLDGRRDDAAHALDYVFKLPKETAAEISRRIADKVRDRLG